MVETAQHPVNAGVTGTGTPYRGEIRPPRETKTRRTGRAGRRVFVARVGWPALLDLEARDHGIDVGHRVLVERRPRREEVEDQDAAPRRRDELIVPDRVAGALVEARRPLGGVAA